MSGLTSRERILGALTHRCIDYVPLSIDMHPSYRTPPFDQARTQFEVIDVLCGLGTDPTVDIWFPIQAAHPDVRITYWREREPAGNGYLRCKRYDTPAGPLQQVVRETADWTAPEHGLFSRTTRGERSAKTPDLEMLDDFNVPRSIEFLIKDDADLDRMAYLFHPLDNEALRKWREEALFAKSAAADRGLFVHARRTFNGSAALWLCDIQDFLCRVAADPPFVERFLRIIQDWQNRAVDVVLDIGVDLVSRFGLYEGPAYWGAKYFDRYLAPLIEEETHIVHAAGALHAQGSSEDLTAYARSLKGMGVDVLMGVDEVQGRDDFAFLKSELGREKSFWGGINSDVTMGTGTDEEIGRAVRNAMRTLAPGGGFVMWPVWSVYHHVPWRSVETLISHWKQSRIEFR